RTHVAPHGPGQSHPGQLEASRVNEVAGKRHDDFRRQGDAGRFDTHQQHNTRISCLGDYRSDEAAQHFDEGCEHSWQPGKERIWFSTRSTGALTGTRLPKQSKAASPAFRPEGAALHRVRATPL